MTFWSVLNSITSIYRNLKYLWKSHLCQKKTRRRGKLPFSSNAQYCSNFPYRRVFGSWLREKKSKLAQITESWKIAVKSVNFLFFSENITKIKNCFRQKQKIFINRIFFVIIRNLNGYRKNPERNSLNFTAGGRLGRKVFASFKQHNYRLTGGYVNTDFHPPRFNDGH